MRSNMLEDAQEKFEMALEVGTPDQHESVYEVSNADETLQNRKLSTKSKSK